MKNKPLQESQLIDADVIVRQAAKMFREKGYRATTLEDIASTFGISRPALYYYFKNKQEILTIIHKQAREKLYLTEKKIYNSNLPVSEKFLRLVENHIEVVATEHTILGIYYEEDKELMPDYFQEVQKSRKDYTNKIIELYKKGVEEKLFRDVDPRIAVFTILGAANWVYRWYRDNGSLSPGEISKVIGNLLSNGYLIAD